RRPLHRSRNHAATALGAPLPDGTASALAAEARGPAPHRRDSNARHRQGRPAWRAPARARSRSVRGVAEAAMRHRRLGLMPFGVCAIAAAAPRVPQNPAYHVMADQRILAGIPNALDVLSNLPFALVGVLGLATTMAAPVTVVRAEARWSWHLFFAATM